MWDAFAELYSTGQLVDFSLASLQRAAIGVFFGTVIGLVLGVLSGLSTLGEELIDSTMQINRAVPFLALVPLFIAWFGIDETFKSSSSRSRRWHRCTPTRTSASATWTARWSSRPRIGLTGWRLVAEAILPPRCPAC